MIRKTAVIQRGLRVLVKYATAELNRDNTARTQAEWIDIGRSLAWLREQARTPKPAKASKRARS